MLGVPPHIPGVHSVADFELNDHRVMKHLHNVAAMPFAGRSAIDFDAQVVNIYKGWHLSTTLAKPGSVLLAGSLHSRGKDYAWRARLEARRRLR